MLKNLGLLVAGLVAGLLIMTLTRPLPDAPGLRRGSDLLADGTSAADVTAVRLEAEARIAAIEERVARLEEERPAVVRAPPASNPVSPQPAQSEVRARGEALSQLLSAQQPPPTAAAAQSAREIQRLIRGGFAPDRAEWIRNKVDALRMEELQARYEAQRTGSAWPADPRDVAFVDRKLREELGDPDYERYMRAFGRATVVAVGGVFAGSPAATAGINPGDEIVSYGGERVFTQDDLNAYILEGAPGESVVVEIDRNGQRLQVVVPRGPMGVTGSGNLGMSNAYGLVNGR